MKQKVNRCEYGHVNAEKRKQLLGAISMVVIALAVFVLGMALNKGDKRNIFTVLSVLFVLPWARYMCTLIVLLPFRTPPEKQYESVKSKLPKGAVLLADYVFSSKETVLGLSYLVLTEHELIGLVFRKKANGARVQAYLSEVLKKRGIAGKVIIFEEEEAFLKRLIKCEETKKGEEEFSELIETLRSLAV